MFLFDTPDIWGPPLWMISVGATIALLILAMVWGAIFLASRPLGWSILLSLRKGVLLPLGIAVPHLIAFNLGGLILPRMPAAALIQSLIEMPTVGVEEEQRFTIAAGEKDHPLELRFSTDQLARLRMESSRSLTIRARSISEPDLRTAYYIERGKPLEWTRQTRLLNPLLGRPKQFTATNLGAAPATLYVTPETGVKHPEAIAIPITTLSVLALVAVYFVLRAAAPKISTIAAAAFKETTTQPLFYLVLAMGMLLLFAFIFLPYNTFGEDIKMLKMNGITLVKVLTVMVTLWTASVSIHEELEGRTALTLLCKPISRRTFVLGKFLGITWAALLMFVLLGLFFLFTVALKVPFDAREFSTDSSWQLCYREVAESVPGLVLGWMEAVILVSIAVALATRLPALANLLICVTIYALGHLVPVIVQSPQGQFPIVRFIGQLLATILPVLMHFNVDAAIVAGKPVPVEYLATSAIYTLLYCTAAMLLALVLFEDRDLA